MLWAANEGKPPKEQLRAIAKQLGLPKTTVIELLSGRRVEEGHIAGGKRKARVLTDGKQVGQFNRNHNQTLNQVTKWVIKWVTALVLCIGDPVGLYAPAILLFHTFLIDQEDELEDLVMYYARRGFPFSDDKLCQLAYELASKTRRNCFSLTKKTAGQKWLHGFLKRKPNLRRKNSQNISAAWAIGINPVQIEKFLELLVQWVIKWKIEFLPNNIWNIDESGLQDVSKSQKVIGVKGERAF